MKCCKCGTEHEETFENCCWVYCKCGAKICGMCGSSDLEHVKYDDTEDSDDQYWCTLACSDCGLIGCKMCV